MQRQQQHKHSSSLVSPKSQRDNESISAATNYIHNVTKRWFGFSCGQIWGHILVSCYEKGKGGWGAGFVVRVDTTLWFELKWLMLTIITTCAYSGQNCGLV